MFWEYVGTDLGMFYALESGVFLGMFWDSLGNVLGLCWE